SGIADGGERMQVGDEIQRLSLVLELEKLADGSVVVAEVELPRRLNAGKNAHPLNISEPRAAVASTLTRRGLRLTSARCDALDRSRLLVAAGRLRVPIHCWRSRPSRRHSPRLRPRVREQDARARTGVDLHASDARATGSRGRG